MNTKRITIKRKMYSFTIKNSQLSGNYFAISLTFCTFGMFFDKLVFGDKQERNIS